ncbi:MULTISPECIES: hypothetical protein [Flavobacterium]|uniref:DUF1097 domain-containing protein n=1 Tax=Flavobacterium lipolyticum TaxID=2893754 RepID=A0ABS8M3X6_9FLAO|nr:MULTISPECIES: hypothetical protein [unclassified Flavobacterium]MCC9019511.1 hypothetical protein [Flavobacterium sp. F-126]
MKKLITFAILFSVLIFMGMLDFFPWWSFSVPMFVLGATLPFKKWNISSFVWGFISGFMAWFLSTIYFEIIYEGEIMSSVAKLMSLHIYLLHLIIGLIGGVLTGLGVYSGYLFRNGREVLELQLTKSE